MRTKDEITKALSNVTKTPWGKDSFLSFWTEVVLSYLTFEEATSIEGLLKEGVTKEDWNDPRPRTREAVLEDMRNYMAEYGWDKALNHRSISASRTIEKMAAWCWLLGDEEGLQICVSDDVPHENYGAPKLKALCQRFGFPDESETNEDLRRMANSKPCREGSGCGCGE